LAMEVLLSSVVASPMLSYRAPLMLDRPEQAWFTIDLSVKDLRLITEAGERLGLTLPSAGVAADVYGRAARLGLGDREMASIYDVVGRVAVT